MMAMKTHRILVLALALVAAGGLVLADTVAGAPITSVDAGKQEVGFGDLVADALRSASGASIAFLPAVSCKPGIIPAGNVSQAQLQSLLQNPGEVWAVANLSGAQVLDALNKSLSRLPGSNNGFLQVSGVQVEYNPEGNRNTRVTSVTIGSSALNAGTQYRVVMPLSLAKGGSGYFTIFDASNMAGDPSTQSLLEALTTYVSSKSSLTYPGTGRIIAQ
jgi:5'-nucleotidase / UDP-sugar diphosphatase